MKVHLHNSSKIKSHKEVGIRIRTNKLRIQMAQNIRIRIPGADPEHSSSLGRYVFGSEISYNKAPPRLPGLGC